MEADGLSREAVRWLRDVHQKRSAGRLESRTATATRELFVREGRIVGVRTSMEAERFGDILMRAGRITLQHFDDASIFVRKGIRMGSILAELRILERAEIEPMLRRQVTEVACAVLGAAGAEVRTEETLEVLTILDAAIGVSEIIMAAARRISSPRRALEALGWHRVLLPVGPSISAGLSLSSVTRWSTKGVSAVLGIVTSGYGPFIIICVLTGFQDLTGFTG